MFEVKEEAEQKLVAQDGLARDDKRQRKLDVEVELESIDGCGGDELVLGQAGGARENGAYLA